MWSLSNQTWIETCYDPRWDILGVFLWMFLFAGDADGFNAFLSTNERIYRKWNDYNRRIHSTYGDTGIALQIWYQGIARTIPLVRQGEILLYS